MWSMTRSRLERELPHLGGAVVASATRLHGLCAERRVAIVDPESAALIFQHVGALLDLAQVPALSGARARRLLDDPGADRGGAAGDGDVFAADRRFHAVRACGRRRGDALEVELLAIDVRA